MSHRDDSITLQEMFDHTVEAMGLVAGLHRSDLDSQRVVCDPAARVYEWLTPQPDVEVLKCFESQMSH
jgi:hypothetical protein